jgi:fructose-bisphosphate aldolase class II
MGSDDGSELVPLEKCIEFLAETRVDAFAPAIGTAHGLYTTTPTIDFERVESIVKARPTPIVLHGGTGLSNDTFRRLISLGCAKVNISTMLKITYCDANRSYLSEKPEEHDPMKLMNYVHNRVESMAINFMDTFGSTGKAA